MANSPSNNIPLNSMLWSLAIGSIANTALQTIPTSAAATAILASYRAAGPVLSAVSFAVSTISANSTHWSNEPVILTTKLPRWKR